MKVYLSGLAIDPSAFFCAASSVRILPMKAARTAVEVVEDSFQKEEED